MTEVQSTELPEPDMTHIMRVVSNITHIPIEALDADHMKSILAQWSLDELRALAIVTIMRTGMEAEEAQADDDDEGFPVEDEDEIEDDA